MITLWQGDRDIGTVCYNIHKLWSAVKGSGCEDCSWRKSVSIASSFTSHYEKTCEISNACSGQHNTIERRSLTNGLPRSYARRPILETFACFLAVHKRIHDITQQSLSTISFLAKNIGGASCRRNMGKIVSKSGNGSAKKALNATKGHMKGVSTGTEFTPSLYGNT